MNTAGHLDLLEVLDAETRGAAGDISTGYDVYVLAGRAGLVADQSTVARWVGELVTAGYVEALGVQGGGRPLPPRGATWSDDDLQRGYRYVVTASGRNESDRVRRLRREQRTDEALGARYPLLAHAWLPPGEREALTGYLRELATALDDQRASAAVGAAKDLVESALKMAVHQRTGQPPSKGASLPALYSAALLQTDSQPRDLPAVQKIGRTLAAVVDGTAELRNAVGTGHGHAQTVDIAMSQARLAASAACAVAEYALAVQRAE